MPRNLACRLARAEMLVPAISWADRQAAHHRQSLRTCFKLCDLISERFRVMGIDPALAVALRRGEEAAAELAAIPDTPDLKAADEAIESTETGDGSDASSKFWEKIEQMAARMLNEDHQLDLANASLAELLTFVLAAEVHPGGQSAG
jgi:hypothetical protein